MVSDSVPRPVVKWVGGKRQLLPELVRRLPEQWNVYMEPFFGGGALFFHLCATQHEGMEGALLGDANPELVNLYKVIDLFTMDLISILRGANYKNNEETYYSVRDQYIDGQPIRPPKFSHQVGRDPRSWLDVARAAQFLYLNKHGYNGLYRVNSAGEFNVPFGRYAGDVREYWDEDNIIAVQRALMHAVIRSVDFSEWLPLVREGNFVYLDPPYPPACETCAGFTGYTVEGFTMADMERVVRFMERADHRGAKVMLSCSANPMVISACLEANFQVEMVNARRNINSDPTGRGWCTEIIARNYGIPNRP